MGRLAGKVAVVTAAGQGIGRAVATRLAADGATVHASDLNADLLVGLDARTARLDATDADAVAAYFDGFDRIDILVHAVGYVHQGTIAQTSLADWHRSTEITLGSAFTVCKYAVPRMTEHGGSLMTIASVASSLRGYPNRVAYCAAKGGVIGLTKALAADHLRDGLRCNAICPGVIDSPSLQDRIREMAQETGSEEAARKIFLDRQPSGRLGQSDEIAAACAFLASDEAGFITGQTIQIDGGITI
ncbi:SDR family oxidoreductase [Jannaschia sp. M317]|nr:SDR family oxidoreductase [Jannaschia sp. M317]